MRFLVPKTIPVVILGTRVLNHWVLGLSGIGVKIGPQPQQQPSRVGRWFPQALALSRVASTSTPQCTSLLRPLWSLLDGIWGLLKGSWGVLAEDTCANEPLPRLFSGIRFCVVGFWAPTVLPLSLKSIYSFPGVTE